MVTRATLPLLLPLLPMAAAAAAEWEQVGTLRGDTLWVLVAATETTADGRRFTARIDHAQPQIHRASGRTYLSTRMQRTVRCETRRMASDWWGIYPEREAKGPVIASFAVSGATFHFSQVAPGSADDLLMKFVCAQKLRH